jgi:hypothetical protein
VNRIVATVFHGAPPTPKHQAAHCDGDKTNDCASNLAWKSRKENEQDKKLHGTYLFGERANGARMTASGVREVLMSDASNHELAAKFGVSYSTIFDIRTRRSWRHVSVPRYSETTLRIMRSTTRKIVEAA